MASTAIGPEQPTVYAQRSAGYGMLALIAAALYDGRTTALVRTSSTLRALDVTKLTSDVDTWMWSEELASQRCAAGDPPRAWTETVRASSDKAVYALTASADGAAPVLRAIVGQASELPLSPPTTHVPRARARTTQTGSTRWDAPLGDNVTCAVSLGVSPATGAARTLHVATTTGASSVLLALRASDGATLRSFALPALHVEALALWHGDSDEHTCLLERTPGAIAASALLASRRNASGSTKCPRCWRVELGPSPSPSSCARAPSLTPVPALGVIFAMAHGCADPTPAGGPAASSDVLVTLGADDGRQLSKYTFAPNVSCASPSLTPDLALLVLCVPREGSSPASRALDPAPPAAPALFTFSAAADPPLGAELAYVPSACAPAASDAAQSLLVSADASAYFVLGRCLVALSAVNTTYVTLDQSQLRRPSAPPSAPGVGAAAALVDDGQMIVALSAGDLYALRGAAAADCTAAGQPCVEGVCAGGVCYCKADWVGELCDTRYEKPSAYAVTIWVVLGSVSLVVVAVIVAMVFVYRSTLWIRYRIKLSQVFAARSRSTARYTSPFAPLAESVAESDTASEASHSSLPPIVYPPLPAGYVPSEHLAPPADRFAPAIPPAPVSATPPPGRGIVPSTSDGATTTIVDEARMTWHHATDSRCNND